LIYLSHPSPTDIYTLSLHDALPICEFNHLVACHHAMTGHPQPGAFFDKVASRDDWPCFAGGLDYLRPRGDGIPSGVNLPTYFMEDRKSTRLNSSHLVISYAVFCLKK